MGQADVDAGLRRRRVGHGHGLGRVAQEVQQDLFDLHLRALHLREAFRDMSDHQNLPEIECFLEIVIVGGQFQGLVHDGSHVAGRPPGLAAAAEVEHVADDVGRADGRGLDVPDHARQAAGLQIGPHGLHVDAQLPGLLHVPGKIRPDPQGHVLGRLHDDGQGVVDLVGHAGGDAAHGDHLLGLDHHLLHALELGHVADHGQQEALLADGDELAGNVAQQEHPVLAAALHLDAAGVAHAEQTLDHQRAVLRVCEHAQIQGAAAQKLLAREPGQGDEGLVDVDQHSALRFREEMASGRA
ncbi:hypothetical protein MASR1M66_21430 [Aminivibrio sp.]